MAQHEALLAGVGLAAGACLLALGLTWVRNDPPSPIAEATAAVAPSAAAQPVHAEAPPLEDATAVDGETDDAEERAPVAVAADGTGVVLRIIDGATQWPIPDAELFLASADQVQPGDGQHWAETVVRIGKAMRADAHGRVMLPPIEQPLRVAARAGERFGCRGLERRDHGEVTLALAPDHTLVVRVLSLRGKPQPDIRVKLCADLTRSLRECTALETDRDGRAAFRHAQLFTTRSPRSNPPRDADFVAIAEVPQLVPAAVRIPAGAFPKAPVELRLDSLGAVTVHLCGPDGRPLRMPCQVSLIAENPPQPPEGISAEAAKGLANLTAQRRDKALGATSVQFAAIGTGLTLTLSAMFADQDFNFRETGLVGPAENEQREVELRMPGRFSVISGRIVLPNGRPAAAIQTEMLVNGQAGRIEGERVPTTDDGAFELPLQIAQPAAPYTLEVQARIAELSVGRTVALPVLQPAVRHDVGEVRLAALPVLAHGAVRDERGEPVAGAGVALQTFRAPAGQSVGWREDSYASTAQTLADGTYRLFGEPRSLRMRLRATAPGHAPAESAEVGFGAAVDLVLERLGGIAALGRAPEWLPRGVLAARLLQDGRSLREEQIRLRRDGSFRLQLSGLRRGTYDLAFELRGVPRPLHTIASIQVEPGSDAPDPRLSDIDLRGTAFRYVVRAVDAAGKPLQPGSPLLARLSGPDGALRDIGFPWRGDRVEFYAADPSVPIVALAPGYRPMRAQLSAGESEVRLQALQPAQLHLPGLRALAGGRQIRISLVFDGDTGMPMDDFSALDQQRGQQQRYARAQMGKSGGAWLGENDVVRVPLMLDGRYHVVARLQEDGAQVSRTLGTVAVALGAELPRVTLVPPAATIQHALEELRTKALAQAQARAQAQAQAQAEAAAARRR